MVNFSYIKDLKLIEISFPYNQNLVNLVKSIPGRQWNPDRKVWFIPQNSVKIALDAFEPFAPQVDENIYNLLETKTADSTLSISEVNAKIHSVLKPAFPSPIWIQGEVLDFKKNSINTAHKFFKLVEKESQSQATLAEINVNIWGPIFQKIQEKIKTCSTPFNLEDGLEIRVLCELTFRDKTASISLKILDIDTMFTVGKLAANREKILAELQAKNLIDKNSSLPLLPFGNRIAVISSLSSDGFNDFINEIKSSHIDFNIIAYNAKVQGKELTKTILQGLEYFKELRDKIDYLVIIRGGGSSTDLIEFDSLELGTAIATFPVKIITGIGHERDKTVIDHLTLSLKTPTKVATFLIDQIKVDYETMKLTFEKIVRANTRILQLSNERLLNKKLQLIQNLNRRFNEEKLYLAKNSKELSTRIQYTISQQRSLVDNLKALLKLNFKNCINKVIQELSIISSKIQSHDPKEILKKGFVYITDKNKQHVKTASELKLPTSLKINFIDGSVFVDANKKELNEKGDHYE